LFIGSLYGDGKKVMQLGETDGAGRFDWVVGRQGQPFALTLRNNGGPRSLNWTQDSIVVDPEDAVDLGDIVVSESDAAGRGRK
jgi:hypothetical protein